MKAVILAGGKGTRLAEVLKDLPKGLLELNGKSVLQYQIENLKKCGIDEIILVIGHQGEKIKQRFGDGSTLSVHIEYFEEKKPLGTAGAFYYLLDKLPEKFLVIYGDLIFDLDLGKFIDFHEKNNALCTLMVHPNDHPYDSDVLVLDEKNRVTNLLKKNVKRDCYYKNCVNAGIALLNKEVLTSIRENSKQDLESDLIVPLIPTGCVFGYRTSEYIRDMGTPDRFKLIQEHISSGIVNKKSTLRKQKAIFLDRDGTLNKHVGFVSRPEDLQLLEEAYPALEMINKSDYLAIVITNQSAVARNLCSLEDLEEIHRKMEVDLGQRRVYIDDLYYCPHHPDKGYPEENVQYKIACKCRKPNTDLIEQAAEKYNIDLSQSYFIGDSMTDIQAGKNASLKTIFLKNNESLEIQPDFYAKDVLEAVKIIMQGV
jgi:D,D-heptose 1,7-bisphosphate phosphatase